MRAGSWSVGSVPERPSALTSKRHLIWQGPLDRFYFSNNERKPAWREEGQRLISQHFKYHETILEKPSGESSVGKAETLLQVKDAEAKAKQTLEQAEEKQRSIVAAARREAVDRMQKAEQDLRAKNESAFAQERQSLSVQRKHCSPRAGTRLPRSRPGLTIGYPRQSS